MLILNGRYDGPALEWVCDNCWKGYPPAEMTIHHTRPSERTVRRIMLCATCEAKHGEEVEQEGDIRARGRPKQRQDPEWVNPYWHPEEDEFAPGIADPDEERRLEDEERQCEDAARQWEDEVLIPHRRGVSCTRDN